METRRTRAVRARCRRWVRRPEGVLSPELWFGRGCIEPAPRDRAPGTQDFCSPGKESAPPAPRQPPAPGVDGSAAPVYLTRLASRRDKCTHRTDLPARSAGAPGGGRFAETRGKSDAERDLVRGPRERPEGGVSCSSFGRAPEARRVRARVAQPAEHFLGKEEAMGSSPIASSCAPPTPFITRIGINETQWPRLSSSATSRT
jgi:hypothetical protein